MKLLLSYCLMGFAAILIQTAMAPLLLPANLAPELLLILAIHLGLSQQGFSGGLTAYTLGLLQDSFAGNCLGLYGLIFLILYLALLGLAEHLNTDSPLLLLFMVLCGTLLQAALLIFLLGFFADAGPAWRTILRTLPVQVALNLASAWPLLHMLQLLRKHRIPQNTARGL